MQAVEERVSDRRVLSLLRAMLRAGVMAQGTVRRQVTGTPQGGVISPLICNVYLHRLDRAWRGAYGTYLRYADLCGRLIGVDDLDIAFLQVDRLQTRP